LLVQMATSEDGAGTAIAWRTRRSYTEKIAAFDEIHTARVEMATAENPGVCANERMPLLRLVMK
jgi:hypothetical protein